MASLIKNQLIKHLSKYAKNLNPDNINVDVLKGKGALHDVELNEALFTEILELPLWVSIQKIVSNTIAIKVPWTSLKTQPIVLFMDEVHVNIVMSSKMRDVKTSNLAPNLTLSSYSNMDYTGYGFINKVIEGITLNINLLEICFSSEHFGGSFTLNQLQVASCTPLWKTGPNLNLTNTRIKESNSNELLLFKLITWQLLRVEASNIIHSTSAAYNVNAPLRFITSQGRSQVAIKKSLITGAVLTGRIQMILNDLLWVATLSQVRSAISFYKYILKLIQLATDHGLKEKADILLNLAAQNQKEPTTKIGGEQPKRPSSVTYSDPAISLLQKTKSIIVNPLFHQFNVLQTSFHFYVDCIDLHICDETNNEIRYPSTWDFQSGALQITLSRLVCDFYPYHLIAGNRDHWVYYQVSKGERWIKNVLKYYYDKFSTEKKFAQMGLVESEVARSWSKMMSLCCLVRLHDLKIYCVSEASSTNDSQGGKRTKAQIFFAANRAAWQQIPCEEPLLTFEFVNYYFPASSKDMPTPPYSTHIQVNPCQLNLDLRTVRWISFVYLDLCKTLELDTAAVESVPHSDVRIEVIMPKMVFSMTRNTDAADTSSADVSSLFLPLPRDAMSVSMKALLLTNVLVDVSDACFPQSLAPYIAQFERINLFLDPFLTGQAENDQIIGSNQRLAFKSLPTNSNALKLFLKTLSGELSIDLADTLSKYASNDTWILELSPFQIDFHQNIMSTTQDVFSLIDEQANPLLLDTTITVWSFMGNKTDMEIENADFYLLVRSSDGLRIFLNKRQFDFLTLASDHISRFINLLSQDSKCFYEALQPKSFIAAALFPFLEISLIFFDHQQPSQSTTRKDDPTCVVDKGSVVDTSTATFCKKTESQSSLFNYGHASISSATSSAFDGGESSGATAEKPSFRVLENIVEFGPSGTYVEYANRNSAYIQVDSSDDELDCTKLSSAFSTTEALNAMNSAVLESDNGSTTTQQPMFEDVFPSLHVKFDHTDSRNAFSADIGEDACELQSSPINRKELPDLDDQIYSVVCKLSNSQFLMTSYDEESYVRIHSSDIRLLDHFKPQVLRDLYNEGSYSERKPEGTSYVDFNLSDCNSSKVKLSIINDGISATGRLEGQVLNTSLSVNLDNANRLMEFFKPDYQRSTDLQGNLVPFVAMPLNFFLSNVDMQLIDPIIGPSPSLKITLERAYATQGEIKQVQHDRLAFPVKDSDSEQLITQLSKENMALRHQLQQLQQTLAQLNHDNSRLSVSSRGV